MPDASKDPRNILIIKLGAFGDVVMADGAVRDIRLNFPKARLTVLTTPAFRRFYEACPHVDAVALDPRANRANPLAMWRLRSALRQPGYDMVFDLQNSGRTRFYYNWMLKDTAWSGTAPGCSHPHRAANPKKIPILDRLEGQLRDAGLAILHTGNPDVRWLEEDAAALLPAELHEKGYVLLVAGASARHPQKKWPYYRELAAALADHGIAAVSAPGPDELGDPTAQPGLPLFDDGKPVRYPRLISIARHARYVVGNDTGPTHLAAHSGARGLALFGSHASARSTSIDRRFDIIEEADISAITVERVLERVLAGIAATATG